MFCSMISGISRITAGRFFYFWILETQQGDKQQQHNLMEIILLGLVDRALFR